MYVYVYSTGLEDRIDVQLIDYRDMKGKFDKIVSVEMLEVYIYIHKSF